MKKILLILFVAASFASHSQDCSSIKREVDKFTGKITLYSPVNNFQFVCEKIIKESDTIYYLSLRYPYANTLTFSAEGVILLQKDSFRIDLPKQKVKVELAGNNYEYSAFMRLSKDDVISIINHPIEFYRLYIYDGKMVPEQQEKMTKYFTCLLEMK